MKGILDAIGDHQAYWELCLGSGAVLFGKPACRQEVANDLHGGLINLARVVQDDELSVALFGRMTRTLFSEDLYELSRVWFDVHRPNPRDNWKCPDWAYHYLVVSWQGRNGLAGTDRELHTGFCKRFTSNGGDPAVRWRSVVDSLPWWWERLRGVTVLSEDCVRLAGRVEDKAGTAVYADPPYWEEGGDYKYGFTPETHEALAAALGRFRQTRVVVSFYDHPRVDELYLPLGFRKLPCPIKKVMAPGAGKVAPEVLLVKN